MTPSDIVKRASAAHSTLEWYDHVIAMAENHLREMRRYREKFVMAVQEADNPAQIAYAKPYDVLSWSLGHATQAASNYRLDLAVKHTVELTKAFGK